MGHYNKRVTFLTEKHDAVQHLLAKDNPYIRAMMFALMQMDVAKFTKWCGERGIVYANNRFTYRTTDVAHMNELKAVVIRKIFLDWFILLLTACIRTDRVQEFNRIPW
jgi:hypothetical protein